MRRSTRSWRSDGLSDLIEVLAIHADQIDRYGGAHGVRDMGLLEAALFRPQTGYYADLIDEAAAAAGRQMARRISKGILL